MKKQDKIKKLMDRIYRKHPWNRGVTAVAAIIVFVTTYMLILPAITLAPELVCPYEENHFHTDACYQDVMSSYIDCEYVRKEGVIVLHTHDERCYQDGILRCPLPEIEGHVHTSECYAGGHDFSDGVVAGGTVTPAPTGGSLSQNEAAEAFASGAETEFSSVNTVNTGRTPAVMPNAAKTGGDSVAMVNAVNGGNSAAVVNTMNMGGNSAAVVNTMNMGGNSAAVVNAMTMGGNSAVVQHTMSFGEDSAVVQHAMSSGGGSAVVSDTMNIGTVDHDVQADVQAAGDFTDEIGSAGMTDGAAAASTDNTEQTNDTVQGNTENPDEPICGKTELVPHLHGSECYDAEGRLICDKPEVVEHQHTLRCISWEVTGRELICGQPEGHIHGEECYKQSSPLAGLFLSTPEQENDFGSETGENAGSDANQVLQDENSQNMAEGNAPQNADDAIEGETALTQNAADGIQAESGLTQNSSGSLEESALTQDNVAGSGNETENALNAAPDSQLAEAYASETETTTEAAAFTAEEISETTTETDAVSDAGAEAEMNSGLPSESASEAEQGSESETETLAEQAAESTSEAEQGSESEMETFAEQAAESTSETEQGSESETETFAEQAAESTSETEQGSESETETSAEQAAESTSEAAAEQGSESETETTTESAAEFTTESATETTTEWTNTIEYRGGNYTVRLTYDNLAGIPADAKLSAEEIPYGTPEYDTYLAQAKAELNLADDLELPKELARFFDIRILDGEDEIEPVRPVRVEIVYDEPVVVPTEETATVDVLHFDEKNDEIQRMTVNPESETIGIGAVGEQDAVLDGESGVESAQNEVPEETAAGEDAATDGLVSEESETEVAVGEIIGDDVQTVGMAEEKIEISNAEVAVESENAVVFTADSFSVYGVIYTVDFHWQVNGKTFDFSIPGGGFIALSDVFQALEIGTADTDTAENGSRFLADVEKVEFSDPSLAWVGKAEAEATVGSLKEANGLEVQYSAELTEEQIGEIDAQTVKAGDWALISLLPFDTEESLTVTMKNEEQFVIRVTDAQTRGDVDVAGRHGVTNTENVKVYSGHNWVINTQIDTIATAGTRVTLLGMESGSLNLSAWYQITYVKGGEQITGYAETKYIDILEMVEPVTGENEDFKTTATWEEGVLPDGAAMEAGVPYLTEEERKTLENQALTVLPVSDGKILKVTGIHFFDLSFMVDGTEEEPIGEVNVSMELKQTIPTEENEGLHLVHFTGNGPELLENAGFTKDAGGNLTGLDFTVGSFSRFAVVKTIETTFVSSNGETYEVTVYYPDGANIPEGAYLQVTEFSEDSDTYEYARKAVLADKKEKNEWVDLSSLGFAALDISILNADGEEIEPDAAVYVDLKIKSLPGVDDLMEVKDTLAIQHHVEVNDGVVVETVYDGSSEASFRMETNATVVAVGSAVDPNTVSEDGFTASVSGGTDSHDIEFEVTAFSTFTISWNNAYGDGVKVHYVDENGHELTVNNSTFLSTLNGSSTSPAYLIYDIDGYEYDHTYRHYYYYNSYRDYGWKNQNILPELARHNASYNANWNAWMYTTDTNGSTWTALNSGDSRNEIYVVYKKKNNIAQGGTPTVKQSGDVDPPVVPRINKESAPNGDDTNTLSLSLISDTTKLEVEKLADVIVVFDVSGSMNTADMGGNTTRLQSAKDAVNNLATQLAKKKNSNGDPLVRMSLIKFSTKASTVLGMTALTDSGRNNGLSKIQSAVNGLTADGGTNWDHALQLANEENDLDSGRATFVIFVTDGDPTFRNARMNVTDSDLAEEKNYHENTNTYTDPNYWYLSDAVYGPGNNDRTGKCYAAAVIQGNAIVQAQKNIYTIGISNDVTKVQTFNTDIHGNGAYLASNSSALQQAFADIQTSISGASGWGNIKMTDGITNLSNTVQKTGLTNVGGDFSYWKAPAPSNWDSMTEAQKKAYKPADSDFVSWDPASEGASSAVYNTETGAVEWNMGSTFMPEAGVTYQVRFKVWPSQEAYDYIAKLNNGTIAYDTLPDDVRAQIIKNGDTYTLKTNEPDAKTTYQSAMKTGDKITVSGETKTLMFPTVDDLNLSVDKMKIQKEWVNDLDPDSRWKSSVTLLLTDGDGNLYKSIELNEQNEYSAEDNFISCGLAKIENNELIIYETGHDFKLTEPEEYAYYWDLDSQVYRPMVINAELTMLIKVDPPSGMGEKTYYKYQSASYYKIGEGTYKAISTGDAAAAITATNIRRSNLNLTKKVVDEEGKPVISDDLFTFTITINDSRDDKVWFSVQTDPNNTDTIVKNLTTDAAPEIKEGEKTGFYYANSGSAISVSIQQGWNLRFTNLPNGTTYTITEAPDDSYTFVNAVIDNNGPFSLNTRTATGTGTINKSNTQYTITYTNKAATQQVYIYKTDQGAQTPLKDAVFSLYSKDGYEAEPKRELKTELVSDVDGLIDLGRLVVGDYYLVETSAPAGYILLADPVEINVEKTGVKYKQISNSQSSDQGENGVTGDADSGYTLNVTNNAGVALPYTGGSGTRIFTILGSILILGAGILLLSRRRII